MIYRMAIGGTTTVDSGSLEMVRVSAAPIYGGACSILWDARVDVVAPAQYPANQIGGAKASGAKLAYRVGASDARSAVHNDVAG